MNHMVLSLAPKFTKLRVLNLSQDKPQLDDNAVETSANNCHDLHDLSKSFKLGDRSLYALAHGFPNLAKLNISGCSGLWMWKSGIMICTDGKIKRSIRGVRTINSIQKVWFIAQVIRDISFWINVATMVVLDENFIKVEFTAATPEEITSGSLSQSFSSGRPHTIKVFQFLMHIHDTRIIARRPAAERGEANLL
ncbi:F-box protein SKP2A-like protein [Tanacetum coccineum]